LVKISFLSIFDIIIYQELL